MKKLLALMLASAMAVSMFAGCGEEKDTDTKSEGDTQSADTSKDTDASGEEVVMGLDTSFAPMGFKDGGEIVGFDVDLAKLIVEEKMGKTLVLQAIDWSQKEAELNTEQIDVVWNGLTMTDERLAAMCFTEGYLENAQVLVVPADSDIKELSDIDGKVLAMQNDSSAQDAYNEFIAENTDVEADSLTLLTDNVLCLTELQQGKADAVIMDLVVADYYLATVDAYKDFTVLDEQLAKELYGIATKKDNTELRDEIQAALDEAIDDGSAGEVATKWFGSDTIYRAE